MSKHTPGPWQYEPSGDCDGEKWGIDHFVMGDGGKVELGCPPTEADALLMAAAPDMLAALKILVADMEAEYRDRCGDMDHDGIEKARAAIAKAESGAE